MTIKKVIKIRRAPVKPFDMATWRANLYAANEAYEGRKGTDR